LQGNVDEWREEDEEEPETKTAHIVQMRFRILIFHRPMTIWVLQVVYRLHKFNEYFVLIKECNKLGKAKIFHQLRK